ncbi:hypothetical protein CPAR01_11608 [Colletotrichum paranaense]|uniref:Zn(2)-C6 fungal-type domain-containing protein n=1 Tax=Colletotrichum paranaense TaxID=1914294 RepID=A0ABQ9SC36_9PEZI|nr:uncharacterized protein CPAR01_11608 [Colletotrichum paranaense]KAK1531959.1 hypothetical protein CPAR01_11608 [Colletotrichum paranaense]
MSNSFFERANPPPRRKTCTACTKAKRRCDHGQPACLRCSRRNIACDYSAPPIPIRSKASNRDLVVRAPKPRRQHNQSSAAPSPVPLLDDNAGSSASLTPWSQNPDLLPLDMGDLEDVNFDLAFDELITSDAFLEGALIAPSLTPKPDDMLVPSYDSAPGSLESVIANRLQYALDEIKMVPTTVVMENQAPWSHPCLYRAHMPRDMQGKYLMSPSPKSTIHGKNLTVHSPDAQACCALYITKNKINSSFVLRTIQARAHELLASPMPKNRHDILARFHAILLYQIIRLFDGDISMRASAQHTLSSLEHTILALLPFVKWEPEQPATGPAQDYTACPTKDFWQEWIFQESARRTIFFTCFFLVAYSALVGTLTNGCEERYVFCQSWTMSAHLWKAPTVVDFAVAWKEKQHLVITKQGFEEALRDAAADDIDAFGKILLVSALGIEDARLWFYNRGSSL